MSRVLVTGASGFIGRHVLRRLTVEDVEVFATSRHVDLENPGAATAVRADLSDPDAAANMLREFHPDVVIHLAGAAVGHNNPRLLRPMFEGQLVPAVGVLTGALEHGVDRVVMAGSLDEVYNSDDQQPTSPYAAAKTATTVYSRLIAGYGLDVVNARIFMGYGPGQGDEKLIPRMARSYLDGRTPEIRNPSRQYDWIEVSDIADALVTLALQSDVTTDGRLREFDVGTGSMIAIGDLAIMLAEVIGCSADVQVGDQDRTSRVERRADPSAMIALGWRASVELPVGLRRVVEQLSSNPRSP